MATVKKEVSENPASNIGYNALTDKIAPDMIKAGIIDPVKVTRGGVQHAVSAAAILLTTEAAIADEPEDKKAAAGGAGGMGGMGGMGDMM